MNQHFTLNINELIKLLWQRKLLIIVVTGIFAIGSVVFALSLPNIYKAEVLLSPQTADNDMRNIGAELGGLAALAGISATGGNSEEVNLALQTITSRIFVDHFITKHELLVPLMALEGWSDKTGDLTYNDQIYDVASGQWTREVEAPKAPEPSAWEAYKVFIEQIEYERLKDSGFVRVSLTSLSPVLAQEWVTWMVTDLNNWVKTRDIEEINKNILYLTAQMKKTELSSMQQIFNNLIEEQVKRLMLAEAQDEYVFKVIDPAVVPEEKVSPKRAVICILGTFLGGIVSVLLVLFLAYRKA
ncbi:Wzz/FepE/Etk N-terminal domain-containing protein [Ferrimonas aestuarii]|uniref:LPS O-antigen length regulator n=1 Tax=Ferrimonas aestuarii TaxID=2569539 RepID=A0A4U1BNV0_9GAMM|nr:Wzz/FepE/Etk N-terminal domain-containing protein [Ferrimonas aestuarii]TKB53937.1 LPS O-antigen length regulator [Ferrimonas aestuarii]